MRAYQSATMAWQDSRKTAERWLESLKLGKIKGAHIDLRDKGDTLAEKDPHLRAQILQAAKRILTARGADSYILPD